MFCPRSPIPTRSINWPGISIYAFSWASLQTPAFFFQDMVYFLPSYEDCRAVSIQKFAMKKCNCTAKVGHLALLQIPANDSYLISKGEAY